MDEDLPPAERESWLYIYDLTCGDYGSCADMGALQIYIFSLYWIFTTLTTVGYGDYTPGTSAERLIVLVFEFIGFCYNAVLISIMSSFFASEATF